jgi:hypothetical protein
MFDAYRHIDIYRCLYIYSFHRLSSIQDVRTIEDREDAIQRFNPRTRAQALHVALGDAERRADGAPALGDEPPATPSSGEARKTSAEIEDAAYNRLVAKKHEKAKGPKGRGSRAATVLKRPGMSSGASRAVKKPPKVIGTVRNIKYKVNWSIADGDDKRSRNTFNCKHYNRAQSVIKTTKPPLNKNDTKATLSKIQRDAGKLWDTHHA